MSTRSSPNAALPLLCLVGLVGACGSGGSSTDDGMSTNATGSDPSSNGAPTGGDATRGSASDSASGNDGTPTTDTTATTGDDPPPTIPTHPFGGHVFDYVAGSTLPGFPQAELDAATASFYDTWKGLYLEEGCGDGRAYVRSSTEAGNLTVSEAHGYGMLLTAIMAGHDPDARRLFDALYRYFRDHPSAFSSDLMAWYQDESCEDANGQDSASDGDIDIAFALLLADKQWGSCGEIDYRTEALAVISSIGELELDETRGYVLLGDWATSDAPEHDATRSSDFITDHFRSFGAASGDAGWEGLADSTYAIVSALQSGHSPTAGLLPDFVTSPLGDPTPAPAGFLEGDNDGAYDYNACRDPWRLATDFLVSGDPRPRDAVRAMTEWLEGETGGDPTQIRAGYQLDGSPSNGSDYLTMAFVAPFGPAAMVDGAHQAWLDAIWQTTVDAEPEGYYEDTIKLLTMIVMSSNWWSPDAAPEVCVP